MRCYEDSRSGVRAGIDAGCFTIAVPNFYTRSQDLSHADLILDSFEGMSVEEFFQTIKMKKAVKMYYSDFNFN